ncbi:MAG: DUF3667 domain-containing protein [Gemmatimonadetes bacterium]|nr:DUF3667 domain-containing protein [Gemmatimonadota bacterium]
MGGYCATCGQSDWNFDLPLVRFVKEFLSESFDLDARLRQTVGPLFLRPGHIPAEYVAGHRARFVPPVRMYILASFVMFLVLSLTANSSVVIETSGDGSETTSSLEASGNAATAGQPEEDDAGSDAEGEDGTEDRTGIEGLSESYSERLTQGVEQAAADPDAFTDLFLNRLAQGMFLLLPAFALLLKGLWRGRLYVHHLIFSIYFHTVVFFVIALAELVAAIPVGFTEYLGAAIILAVPAHLVLGVKRFYGSGWWSAVLKSTTLGAAYVVVLIATLMGLLLLSVLYL